MNTTISYQIKGTEAWEQEGTNSYPMTVTVTAAGNSLPLELFVLRVPKRNVEDGVLFGLATVSTIYSIPLTAPTPAPEVYFVRKASVDLSFPSPADALVFEADMQARFAALAQAWDGLLANRETRTVEVTYPTP